ncbi:DUF4097 family beta strand repeat-containing protein [Dictyobacter aurantiacus]|uniref:DUF4097 domain-containing protein n=1 Tax=Dictyobacter aurantiacus TaxID=1936993 RepID=A0A401ZBU6_9CHLR|nr:DUF4097 family beta strand repeat-containing protein [Dictyobacter aurantiacus]GCE04273.1 hypothetical protein KDAU_16020 [Dictyobacter aurantiacus]
MSKYLETGQASPKRQKKQQQSSPSNQSEEQAETQEMPAADECTVEIVPPDESDVASSPHEEAQAEAVAAVEAAEITAEGEHTETEVSEPIATTSPTTSLQERLSKWGMGLWSPLYGPHPAPDWRLQRSNQNDLGRILMFILLIALVVGLIAVGIINRAGTQNASESYFFPQQEHQKIVINNDTGTIHIHSQAHGPFSFQVNKYSEGMGLGLINTDVTYNQDGAKTTVDARLDPDYLFAGSRGVDIDVTIPPTASVEAYTAAGTITITGNVSQTSARTASGSIVVDDSEGNMTLQADTGSIALHNVKGQLNASTRQGDIETRHVQLTGQSSMTVDNGAITFDGSLARTGNFHFTTINGSLSLSLPRFEAFHISVSSGSGPVSNEFGRLSNGKRPQAQIAVSTQRDAITIHQTR